MKQCLTIVLSLLASFCFFSGARQDVLDAGSPEKQKGISYAAWWPGLYSLSDSDISLAHLAKTGANWISLIVTCYQDNVSSTKIAANETTPTDEDLIYVIARAHELGLKVMLKPHLDLADDADHWRGQIGSAFTTEAQWTEWFSSYRAFIEHYAKLAGSKNADQFCAGTELEGTSHREADWRNVIAGVRSLYSGPLVYAANHSGEESRLTWWDAVDFIGVDAYYPLASHLNPTIQELKAAWRPHVSALANLVSRWQKPILLTEIGYRSIDGTASHPWDWQIQGKVDLQEQADCYQAAFESVYDQPWFGGIFWWSWSPDPLEGGPYDTGYTPHEKPAEDIIRTWFGGPERWVISQEPESNYDRTLDIFIDALGPGWEDWSWDAERQVGATDQVRHGISSIRAKLGPWGALSFWHAPFSSHPYYRLEFYIRASSPNEPLLWACFSDESGKTLVHAPVNDRRWIEGGKVEAGKWKLVAIPLRDLGASKKKLSRLSLQEHGGTGTGEFWVDSLRLVGGKWRKDRGRLDKK